MSTLWQIGLVAGVVSLMYLGMMPALVREWSIRTGTVAAGLLQNPSSQTFADAS